MLKRADAITSTIAYNDRPMQSSFQAAVKIYVLNVSRGNGARQRLNQRHYFFGRRAQLAVTMTATTPAAPYFAIARTTHNALAAAP